ncbi:MAG TPA: hypothetical protein VJ723_03885 [Candidatus Angelobacter sp.]|nr:hypothetical protein [Candidatus Angelobacter sp.]
MKKRSMLFLAVSVIMVGACASQNAHNDISSIVAAGKVQGNQYENAYFGLTIVAGDADIQAPAAVNVKGRQARLIQIISRSRIWDNIYTFAILADSRANYPPGQSVTEYVRNFRHRLEGEGLQTIKEEFPVVMSGVSFTEAILREGTKGDRPHVRAILSTSRNEYMLTFDVEAPTEERLQQLISSMIKWKAKSQP